MENIVDMKDQLTTLTSDIKFVRAGLPQEVLLDLFETENNLNIQVITSVS